MKYRRSRKQGGEDNTPPRKPPAKLPLLRLMSIGTIRLEWRFHLLKEPLEEPGNAGVVKIEPIEKPD